MGLCPDFQLIRSRMFILGIKIGGNLTDLLRIFFSLEPTLVFTSSASHLSLQHHVHYCCRCCIMRPQLLSLLHHASIVVAVVAFLGGGRLLLWEEVVAATRLVLGRR